MYLTLPYVFMLSFRTVYSQIWFLPKHVNAQAGTFASLLTWCLIVAAVSRCRWCNWNLCGADKKRVINCHWKRIIHTRLVHQSRLSFSCFGPHVTYPESYTFEPGRDVFWTTDSWFGHTPCLSGRCKMSLEQVLPLWSAGGAESQSGAESAAGEPSMFRFSFFTIRPSSALGTIFGG